MNRGFPCVKRLLSGMTFSLRWHTGQYIRPARRTFVVLWGRVVAICLFASARYLPFGSIRWKLYCVRLVSTSGLLTYFSLVRSSRTSIPLISGPLSFANRMIAYCAAIVILLKKCCKRFRSLCAYVYAYTVRTGAAKK